MISDTVPSEHTPLSRRNVIDISGSSSGGSSSSSSNTMNDTRRIVIKIVIDFLVVALVGFPILAFFLWGKPYQRGFFCDDESLMHPFHLSTIPNWLLYVIGLVLPVILITITEIVQAKIHKSSSKKKLQLGSWEVPTWLKNAYIQIGFFGFGAAVSQLTTDVGKYSIGRLRPHFFNVCQPVMPDGTTCANTINLDRYIEEFTCVGESSTARMLKEMRLSFPSGHASFSAYTMIYCAIFLHARMTWRGSKLLKNFMQFVLILFAWFTSMTRISDYKHHWSDVLAGAALGSIVAIVVSNFVSNLFVPKNKLLIPQTRYELNTPTNGV